MRIGYLLLPRLPRLPRFHRNQLKKNTTRARPWTSFPLLSSSSVSSSTLGKHIPLLSIPLYTPPHIRRAGLLLPAPLPLPSHPPLAAPKTMRPLFLVAIAATLSHATLSHATQKADEDDAWEDTLLWGKQKEKEEDPMDDFLWGKAYHHVRGAKKQQHPGAAGPSSPSSPSYMGSSNDGAPAGQKKGSHLPHGSSLMRFQEEQQRLTTSSRQSAPAGGSTMAALRYDRDRRGTPLARHGQNTPRSSVHWKPLLDPFYARFVSVGNKNGRRVASFQSEGLNKLDTELTQESISSLGVKRTLLKLSHPHRTGHGHTEEILMKAAKSGQEYMKGGGPQDWPIVKVRGCFRDSCARARAIGTRPNPSSLSLDTPSTRNSCLYAEPTV